MMSTFRVGQKIICVDAESRFGGWILDGIKKGGVYTVRALGYDNYYHVKVVFLDEIIRPIDDGWEEYGEVGFDASRFKPVAYPRQSIEHDTELFLPLLTKRELVE